MEDRSIRATPSIALYLTLAPLLWLGPGPARAEAEQTPPSPSPQPPSQAAPSPAIDDTFYDAAEADGAEPRRKLVRWNEYEGPYFTARLGGGMLFDAVTYSQDEDSESQMTLDPDVKLRDFRILLKGRFPTIPRLSYTLGYMYDANEKSWRFRQTGLMVDVPEFWGRLFIGRTKEGISMNKIMVGYYGWTMERATANDAFVPILADGLKWMGNSPSGEYLWSIGWFGDRFSEKETFNRFDTQVTLRGVWLPLPADTADESLLHVGLGLRWAKSNDGFFQFKSKPESFPAQSNAVDTGEFPADHSYLAAPELYYRRGPWVVGAEYFLHQVSSKETDDPFFHGGEVLVAYLLTGETRPYNRKGGHFEAVSPAKTVFSGGRGAWELVLRFSYTDMDDEGIEGGTFWRLTPMVNWYLSDNLRLELTYGFGVLDRFDLRGSAHFLGARFQFQL
jgi:phosphate-selective porin OprO/OprP